MSEIKQIFTRDNLDIYLNVIYVINNRNSSLQTKGNVEFYIEVIIINDLAFSKIINNTYAIIKNEEVFTDEELVKLALT